jgi:hypothetical protein
MGDGKTERAPAGQAETQELPTFSTRYQSGNCARLALSRAAEFAPFE